MTEHFVFILPDPAGIASFGGIHPGRYFIFIIKTEKIFSVVGRFCPKFTRHIQ
jgi:hypothetical protein